VAVTKVAEQIQGKGMKNKKINRLIKLLVLMVVGLLGCNIVG
jgi:hypothetical protein